MKGLLLKDCYMIGKYCKSYLLMAVIFLAVSFTDAGNLFFVFYPVILCGMIPVNLLGYDEQSHWLQYSDTLPYTRTQIVTVKYLIGLFLQLAMMIVTGTAYMINMKMNGLFQIREFGILMLMLLVVSIVISALALPCLFKWGVEKGRGVYYFMIGCAFAASIGATRLIGTEFSLRIKMSVILAGLCVAGIGIYILSWYLSTVFYRKREL